MIPVSGGKDGTYVTDQLQNKYSMNPLCITVKPALELDIGKINLQNGYIFYHGKHEKFLDIAKQKINNSFYVTGCSTHKHLIPTL